MIGGESASIVIVAGGNEFMTVDGLVSAGLGRGVETTKCDETGVLVVAALPIGAVSSLEIETTSLTPL